MNCSEEFWPDYELPFNVVGISNRVYACNIASVFVLHFTVNCFVLYSRHDIGEYRKIYLCFLCFNITSNPPNFLCLIDLWVTYVLIEFKSSCSLSCLQSLGNTKRSIIKYRNIARSRGISIFLNHFLFLIYTKVGLFWS